MTVVLNPHRPGVAPDRGAIEAIVAGRNHTRNGDLTLDWLPCRGLRCNSYDGLHRSVGFRCGAGHQWGVRHCSGFRVLRVRESRRKDAEWNQKGKEVEAKVAGEPVLRTPQREYKVKNSIAWQRVTRSVEFDRKAPKPRGVIRS